MEYENRNFCMVANWKMNVDKEKVEYLAENLKKCFLSTTHQKIDIIVACPFVYLDMIRRLLPSYVAIAGQNCYKEKSGPFTGEISPLMLKDVGCEWVILGHSERRSIFKESDDFVGEKVAFALQSGLKVIACFGETDEERRNGQTEEVIFRQMDAIANKMQENDWKHVILAYEPVWAIGTGQSAQVTEIREVHSKMRRWVFDNVSEEVAETIRIIYGGSVSVRNCCELTHDCVDVDGLLLGSASVTAEFTAIIDNVVNEVLAEHV